MERIENITPGAGSAYRHGWRVMSDKFISLFLVIMIIIVASIPVASFFSISEMNLRHDALIALAVLSAQVFGFAYSLFVLSPLEYGSKLVYLKAARKDDFEVKDMFDVFKNYLNVVLASLLTGAIIAFGIFFLIIPGIVFACRLVFVPYLVMDKKLDPVKAVEESWRLTKGHGWRIFWMGIMAFFIFIGGLIVLFFGVFIAAMWVKATFASFYQAVLVEKGEYIIPNGDR
ncbi:MAG: glycerophosphoryl diester phosphodiesterase membrane domain-containing protein [Bacteroidota bacterium]